MSLADHEARVAHDLACLGHGKPSWVTERPGTHDVIIVGGGQSGLGAAFALQRERVSNILVLDENAAGFEGPWETYARMITLRTPKDLISIDLGIPSLTFRQFWEAQHGPEGWARIDKIARQDWMAYLRWYRRLLELPVVNETKVTLVEPLEDGTHKVHVTGPGAPADTLRARKVILATGIQGGGEWHTPDLVKSLPRHRYAHTSEPIDYARFAGQRIGILGAGASSFDNAQHALAEGVAEAHVFVRRAALPQVNPIRFMEQAGLIGRYADLEDEAKYRFMASFFARVQPPTNDTFGRAAAWPGFRLHLGAPWSSVEETPEGVAVTTPQGRFLFDFLVLSTGLVTDPQLRPELRLVAGDIVRWGERYSAPAELANPLIDAHPYVGPGFELQGRDAGGAARLYGLFAFNYSGLISLGLSASALSGLRYALPRLAQAVAGQLFRDDQEPMLAAFEAYDEPEFASEWRAPEEAAA